jgi:hypothetical protein
MAGLRFRTLSTAVAVAIGLSACASDGRVQVGAQPEVPQATPTNAPQSTPSSPAGNDLMPLLTLQDEDAQFLSWFYARYNLVLPRCFAAHGKTVKLPDPGAVSLPSKGLGRYGGPHVDSDGVARYSGSKDATSSVDAPTLTPAELTILDDGTIQAQRDASIPGGRPIGSIRIGRGCYADTLVEVFGSLDNFLDYWESGRIVEALSNGTASEVWQSPDAGRASAEWSACMSTNGHKLKDPTEASAKSFKDSREEAKTAKDDKDCRTLIDLERRVATVESSLQRKAAEKNSGVISRLRSRIAFTHERNP